ncbi:LOW QUALITY PROTEIN: afadin [Lates calcarifer]|uniref:LOW QUALITY PROTEIN: afadin n=1 Tax=Lates calcarifer TaxID=8187 RepID=A0AAJ7PS89_LATCA|nr:LOW QUALITY PROTEIN: afadin [Lates calcarifer]
MPEEEEREKLAKVIRQWNDNRLDLFEISQPNENLEFHGIMRFYFEDHGDGNVATKCLRVCSNSPTHEIIETLSEKFRPDMKMLTTSYSLYEIHAKKERKLDMDERPLIVQLNWNSDNREGRFVLKKDQESFQENCHEKEKGGMIQNFKRTLSRKEKKTEKNKTKAAEKISADENGSTEKPLHNSICVSNHETIKDCTENKKQQRQAAPDQPRLPFEIKFCDKSKEALLSAVINYTNSSTVHFKLSPAYILYAVGRFALQRHYRQGSPPSGQTHGVTLIANKMVAMTGKVIQRQQTIAGALAFWMANSSELLNFFKHDKDLCLLTAQSQLDLSHLVHKAYSCLLQCLQNELTKHLPTFVIDPEQHGPLPAGIEMVLNTLMNTMSLLRRCRVNPALTIQLFSQLFHFISAWLFNQLMSPEADTPGLRSHYWGAALRQRLTAIEAWAERQGLELAADCHLGHIVQATTLLTMNKYSMQDAKDIQQTCFKLNSLQLHTLLAGYLYANNEPHIPPDLIDAVVMAAKASADNLIRGEGRDIQLEESLDLHLPFLLPEGGYSCDTVRGIPPGFREFLEPVYRKGLCSLTSQPNSKGDWTVFFSDSTPSAESMYLAAHREPEIVTITLNKPLNSGMGVSIVAAKGARQGNLGIYIKSIVKGGPAEMNGRLAAGDQLLSVDGQSLVGLSQERAAAIMVQTGPVVTLQVAKFGASYHGLGALLSEAAPEKATGDTSNAKPNSKALMLYSVVDPGPSEQQHGSSRRKKEQIMQRNRQLYRSNPNMTTDLCPEDGAEPVNPAVRGNNSSSVSTINLCTDTLHREYLTLPTPKSQDKNTSEPGRPQQTFKVSLRPLDGQSCSKKTLMRQALSQENLCMDRGGPLLDKRQNMWEQQDWSAKQPTSYYSSFPIRSSVSTHDILSDNTSPKNRQQGTRTSAAGVWRSPFSQHPTPTPSIQPIRIDIPITRAVTTQSNPPLITFQSSSLLSMKMNQTLKVNGHKQSPENPASHIYACPISATKKLPQPSLSSQQQRPSIFRGQAVKPQVSITPTKHVSFQEPPTQPKQGMGPVKQKDPQEVSDPWRREAQEKLEKQQRLQVVELLEQEVQELQAKVQRSTEENDRLRKLSLEWQFQKRLREIQQRGEDEDEEDDEDLDMMMTIQQLETRAQSKRSSGGNINSEFKELERKTGSHISQKEQDEAKTGQRQTGLTEDVHKVASKENQEEKIKRTMAPEKLTFKERQRLFSLASSA